MCGLFGGASTTLMENEIERVAQLGILSQLRGTDSTGIVTCYRDKGIQIDVKKDTKNSSEFFYSEDIQGFLKEKKPFVIAGHCRAATVGSVTVENAHPYYLGRIIGMKNGTVHNLRGKKPDETDSQALLRILQDEGLEAAMYEAQHGAYALVWIDSREGTLNFVRNSLRPLWMMKAQGSLYWASEYGMLNLIRERSQINYKDADVRILPAETHYSVRLNSPYASGIDKKIDVKPKVFYTAKSENPWAGWGTTKKEDDKCELPGDRGTALTAKPALTFQQGSELAPPGLAKIIAYGGKTLKIQKARKILACGCAGCARVLPFSMIEDAHMFNNDDWLCGECNNAPLTRLQVGAKDTYQIKLEIKGEKDAGSRVFH